MKKLKQKIEIELKFFFYYIEKKTLTNQIYRATNGLGTKCTNSEQRVPKSFPVIGRQRKGRKLAEMESIKY